MEEGNVRESEVWHVLAAMWPGHSFMEAGEVLQAADWEWCVDDGERHRECSSFCLSHMLAFGCEDFFLVGREVELWSSL